MVTRFCLRYFVNECRSVRLCRLRWSLYKKLSFPLRTSSLNVTKIRRKLRIWSHLLEKSLMENFIFCAVWMAKANGKVHFFCSGLLSFYSFLDLKHPSCANLVQEFKIVSLSWNLVPGLFRICKIPWWCSFFCFRPFFAILPKKSFWHFDVA